ncbi:MAG: hypothetical protein M1819_002442 [Sarea resinae]|nr:MAG: hypothetical protein M1819_002442 [Sarea resinae]
MAKVPNWKTSFEAHLRARTRAEARYAMETGRKPAISGDDYLLAEGNEELIASVLEAGKQNDHSSPGGQATTAVFLDRLTDCIGVLDQSTEESIDETTSLRSEVEKLARKCERQRAELTSIRALLIKEKYDNRQRDETARRTLFLSEQSGRLHSPSATSQDDHDIWISQEPRSSPSRTPSLEPDDQYSEGQVEEDAQIITTEMHSTPSGRQGISHPSEPFLGQRRLGQANSRPAVDILFEGSRKSDLIISLQM